MYGNPRFPQLSSSWLLLLIPQLLAQECPDACKGWNTPSELPPEGSGPKSGCFGRKSEGCLPQGSSCGEVRPQIKSGRDY